MTELNLLLALHCITVLLSLIIPVNTDSVSLSLLLDDFTSNPNKVALVELINQLMVGEGNPVAVQLMLILSPFTTGTVTGPTVITARTNNK